MTKLSAPGAPFQYAWHVPDLEKAADYWANVLGIGPFFLNEVDTSGYEGFTYRGGGGNLTMRLAWAQSKEGQIELIQVTSSEPNVYHDLIAPDKGIYDLAKVMRQRLLGDIQSINLPLSIRKTIEESGLPLLEMG